MANANEELDSQNQSSGEDVNTDEIEDTGAQSETEDLEALREQNKRLFERAKKSEAEAKLLKAERMKAEEQAKAQAPKSSEKQDEFDLEDVAALVNKVSNKEDRQLVKEFAKFKKISLEDAMNNPIITAELKDRAEKRQTAQATNTGTARRGAAKPTPEAILAAAEQGKFPDDPEALAEARFETKRKK